MVRSTRQSIVRVTQSINRYPVYTGIGEVGDFYLLPLLTVLRMQYSVLFVFYTCQVKCDLMRCSIYKSLQVYSIGQCLGLDLWTPFE